MGVLCLGEKQKPHLMGKDHHSQHFRAFWKKEQDQFHSHGKVVSLAATQEAKEAWRVSKWLVQEAWKS